MLHCSERQGKRSLECPANSRLCWQAVEDAMLFSQIQEPAVCVLRHIDSEACPKGPEDLELWKIAQHESVPSLYAEGISSDRFWSSHVQTYLERDMHPPINLKIERGFCNFMIAAAARSGQLFDATSIASGIDAELQDHPVPELHPAGFGNPSGSSIRFGQIQASSSPRRRRCIPWIRSSYAILRVGKLLTSCVSVPCQAMSLKPSRSSRAI